MTLKKLCLVKTGTHKIQEEVILNEDPRAYDDHQKLLASYLQSHRVRNHSEKTIVKESAFLKTWFLEHGTPSRPLYTWEAMLPIRGRKRIIDYGNALITSGVATNTVRAYLGILSRYFSFVLAYPFVGETEALERISNRYHEIHQPVSEFDLPKHVYNGEKLGVPFDPEKLYDFFSIIREKYLHQGRNQAVRARNYAMIVLAGESGLRVDELLHLEIVDLFFESHKVQTRFAKGTRGSGKRARTTLFSPLARDSVKYYLSEHRPYFVKTKDSPLLFLSKSAEPLDYTSAHLALKEMVQIANENHLPIAEHMSFHWLRRFFATRFIERFPNQLSVLVTLLGHQTPNTVHCYIRHSEAWMDEKILDMLKKGGSSWPSIGS
jgi:integrase